MNINAISVSNFTGEIIFHSFYREDFKADFKDFEGRSLDDVAKLYEKAGIELKEFYYEQDQAEFLVLSNAKTLTHDEKRIFIPPMTAPTESMLKAYLTAANKEEIYTIDDIKTLAQSKRIPLSGGKAITIK